MATLLVGGVLFAFGLVATLVRRDVWSVVTGTAVAVVGGATTAAGASGRGVASLALLGGIVVVAIFAVGRAIAARAGAVRANELDASRW